MKYYCPRCGIGWHYKDIGNMTIIVRSRMFNGAGCPLCSAKITPRPPALYTCGGN